MAFFSILELLSTKNQPRAVCFQGKNKIAFIPAGVQGEFGCNVINVSQLMMSLGKFGLFGIYTNKGTE